MTDEQKLQNLLHSLQKTLENAEPSIRVRSLQTLLDFKRELFKDKTIEEFFVGDPSFFSPIAPDPEREEQEKKTKQKLLCYLQRLKETPSLVRFLVGFAELVPFEAGQTLIYADKVPEGLLIFPASLEVKLPTGGSIQRSAALLGGLSLSQPPRASQITCIARQACTALLLPAEKLQPILCLHPDLQEALFDEILQEEEQELSDALRDGGICQEQQRQIRAMINNMGQAVFTLDPNGEIGEFSGLAARFLGYEDLTGRPFADLVLRQNEKKLKSYYRALRLLHSGNRLDPGVVLSLLPAELTLNEAHYRFHYQIIEDIQGYVLNLIVRMEEISKELEMARMRQAAEEEREKEQHILDQVRNNIGSFLNLLELIEENQTTLKKYQKDFVDPLLPPDQQQTQSLVNSLHTIKGLCSQFEITPLKTAAHQMEGAVRAFALTPSQKAASFKEQQKQLKKQYRYTQSLVESLGEKVLSILRGIHFSPAEFDQLRQAVDEQNWKQAKWQLQKKIDLPLSAIAEGWEKDIAQLAGQLGKEVAFEVQGDENLLLPIAWVKTLNAELRHIYRNALDHGFETPKERTQAKKPPQGQLRLEANEKPGMLELTLSDDGRGIDFTQIIALAKKKPELDQAVIEDLIHQNEAWRILLLPGFSSAKQLSSISGRGVGLDAVEQALAKLGGTLKIETEKGKGSRFIIQLPWAGKG